VDIKIHNTFLVLVFYEKHPIPGFDLTTHSSTGGDDTTRPCRQGKTCFYLFVFDSNVCQHFPWTAKLYCVLAKFFKNFKI
jgi:hypothetical protein